jgi:hypothetical protein
LTAHLSTKKRKDQLASHRKHVVSYLSLRNNPFT